MRRLAQRRLDGCAAPVAHCWQQPAQRPAEQPQRRCSCDGAAAAFIVFRRRLCDDGRLRRARLRDAPEPEELVADDQLVDDDCRGRERDCGGNHRLIFRGAVSEVQQQHDDTGDDALCVERRRRLGADRR